MFTLNDDFRLARAWLCLCACVCYYIHAFSFAIILYTGTRLTKFMRPRVDSARAFKVYYYKMRRGSRKLSE